LLAVGFLASFGFLASCWLSCLLLAFFSSDFIGAPLLPDMETNGFVAAGTCTDQLMGMCESMWKPDLEPEQLFETISQCLLAGADRDCLSGWGATVYIICPDKVITRTLRGRMD